jgi:hypothetical protein
MERADTITTDEKLYGQACGNRGNFVMLMSVPARRLRAIYLLHIYGQNALARNDVLGRVYLLYVGILVVRWLTASSATAAFSHEKGRDQLLALTNPKSL